MRYFSVLIMFFSTASYAASQECRWCIAKDKKVRSELLELSKKKPGEILASIRGKGVCVKVLKTSRKMPEKFFHWGQVEEPKEELSAITKDPHVMGKTLCKGEKEISKDCPTIFLAADAPLSTLFHEYLHTRQIEKDKDGVWCKLAKKLWSDVPDKTEAMEVRNREWDVRKFLWENQSALGLGIEDKLTIADETIGEAKARAAFDPGAKEYIESQKIPAKLQELIADYMKAVRASAK